MADIELVVKLPEKVYEQLVKYGEPLPRGNTLDNIIMKAVANGTPLPKGHGRLIDADALEGHRQIQIVPCGNGKYTDITVYYQNDIDITPTIIEADKAESEE